MNRLSKIKLYPEEHFDFVSGKWLILCLAFFSGERRYATASGSSVYAARGDMVDRIGDLFAEVAK